MHLSNLILYLNNHNKEPFRYIGIKSKVEVGKNPTSFFLYFLKKLDKEVDKVYDINQLINRLTMS